MSGCAPSFSERARDSGLDRSPGSVLRNLPGPNMLHVQSKNPKTDEMLIKGEP